MHTFMAGWSTNHGTASHNLQKTGHVLMFSCIADDVRQGFDVHFAETYEDVYKVALDYHVDSL